MGGLNVKQTGFQCPHALGLTAPADSDLEISTFDQYGTSGHRDLKTLKTGHCNSFHVLHKGSMFEHGGVWKGWQWPPQNDLRLWLGGGLRRIVVRADVGNSMHDVVTFKEIFDKLMIPQAWRDPKIRGKLQSFEYPRWADKDKDEPNDYYGTWDNYLYNQMVRGTGVTHKWGASFAVPALQPLGKEQVEGLNAGVFVSGQNQDSQSTALPASTSHNLVSNSQETAVTQFSPVSKKKVGTVKKQKVSNTDPSPPSISRTSPGDIKPKEQVDVQRGRVPNQVLGFKTRQHEQSLVVRQKKNLPINNFFAEKQGSNVTRELVPTNNILFQQGTKWRKPLIGQMGIPQVIKPKFGSDRIQKSKPEVDQGEGEPRIKDPVPRQSFNYIKPQPPNPQRSNPKVVFRKDTLAVNQPAQRKNYHEKTNKQQQFENVVQAQMPSRQENIRFLAQSKDGDQTKKEERGNNFVLDNQTKRIIAEKYDKLFANYRKVFKGKRVFTNNFVGTTNLQQVGEGLGSDGTSQQSQQKPQAVFTKTELRFGAGNPKVSRTNVDEASSGIGRINDFVKMFDLQNTSDQNGVFSIRPKPKVHKPIGSQQIRDSTQSVDEGLGEIEEALLEGPCH